MRVGTVLPATLDLKLTVRVNPNPQVEVEGWKMVSPCRNGGPGSKTNSTQLEPNSSLLSAATAATTRNIRSRPLRTGLIRPPDVAASMGRNQLRVRIARNNMVSLPRIVRPCATATPGTLRRILPNRLRSIPIPGRRIRAERATSGPPFRGLLRILLPAEPHLTLWAAGTGRRNAAGNAGALHPETL